MARERLMYVPRVCGSALEGKGISAVANHRHIFEIGVFLQGGGRKVIRPLNQARTVRHIPQDRKNIGSDGDGGFEWRRIIDFIP